MTSRRELEQQMKSEHRLPPGQAATVKFPVLHYGPVPETNLDTWTFRIFGDVEQEQTWTWQEFNQLPKTQLKMDIHCVTRWSKFDTLWEGVSVGELVRQGIITPKPKANFVIQHAEYEYSTNLPLDVTLADNFLLATHFDGKPLDPDHGYPLRGIIGNIVGRQDIQVTYFWKGAKWIRALEFTSLDKPGFWEEAGYHNRGNVWQEERTD
jgi:DMSO/TMAO reductase YedYZ molybdopterin-dependent catalytic subunit